jgi:hypothetical protein
MHESVAIRRIGQLRAQCISERAPTNGDRRPELRHSPIKVPILLAEKAGVFQMRYGKPNEAGLQLRCGLEEARKRGVGSQIDSIPASVKEHQLG